MEKEQSQDTIFHGALTLAQSRKGYRFTEDAIYLGAFAARGGRVTRAADFGAGCGVVGFALLQQEISTNVIFIEIQTSMAAVLQANGALNGFGQRATVIQADFRHAPIAENSLALIVCNPPYIPHGRGRLPQKRERAIARHEIACSPRDLSIEAARCLRPDGRLCVVYPASRQREVTKIFESEGLSISRIQLIFAFSTKPPGLVLIEAQKRVRRGSPLIEEPLIVHRADGSRPPEVEHILAGRWEKLGSTRKSPGFS